jgi:hypothetical protein
MKFRKKELEIFNLSFLDIISCGFGAVIILILVSKTSEDISVSGANETGDLLKTVFSLQNKIQLLVDEITQQSNKNNLLSDQGNKLLDVEKELTQSVERKQQEEEILEKDQAGLALVQSTLKQASIKPKETKNIRDEEVGGIPVDSDYVIFIIDTSGSMKQIWGRVSSEIINVLNIHPKVKGFQIINDLGKSLISGYHGKWMPDTPQRRKDVIKVFHYWGDASNSSPVEGINVALKIYAKPNISTSIYVFGDDYTGSSYDPVIEQITKLNKSKLKDKRLAKIHGVGFISPHTTNRFAILMRELTKRNGGTFLALPF